MKPARGEETSSAPGDLYRRLAALEAELRALQRAATALGLFALGILMGAIVLAVTPPPQPAHSAPDAAQPVSLGGGTLHRLFTIVGSGNERLLEVASKQGYAHMLLCEQGGRAGHALQALDYMREEGGHLHVTDGAGNSVVWLGALGKTRQLEIRARGGGADRVGPRIAVLDATKNGGQLQLYDDKERPVYTAP